MKCHVCGGHLQNTVTDLPFKTGPRRIVIVKDLPLLQCNSCGEYLLEDKVMEEVEFMLAKAHQQAELEIVRYAA